MLARGDGKDGTAHAVLAAVTTVALHELWRGEVGRTDEDGTSTVEVALDGGRPLRWQERARLTGCDGAPLRTFVEGFDFARGAFRPLAPKGALPTPDGAAPLPTSASPPPGLGDAAIAATFAQRGVTSAIDDGGTADGLGAAPALTDGDPRTAWREGKAGPGLGETLLYQAPAPRRVLALRLVPGDGQSAAAFGKSARLRRAIVRTDTRAFVVQLEPAPGAPTAVWATFPDGGVDTRCLSVTIADVWPGRGATAKQLAIAELAPLAVTDGMGPEALAAHAQTVASGGAAAALAARALAAAGPAGLDALRTAYQAGNDASRPRLRAALAAFSGDESALTLAAWLRSTDDDALATALATRLAALGPRGHELLFVTACGLPPSGTMIEQWTCRDDAPLVGRAAAAAAFPLLPAETRARAGAVLAALLGHGPRALRARAIALLSDFDPFLARTTTTTPSTADPIAATADAWAVRATSARRLGPSAPELGALAPLAANLLDAMRPRPEAYELRARLCEFLAAAGQDATLTSALAAEPDPAVRVHAMRWLPPGHALLATGLADRDPGVRLAALAAQVPGGVLASASIAPVAALAASDPWPTVREAAVVALGTRCAPGADAERTAATTALLARLRDDRTDDVRRAAVVALVTCRAPEAGAALLDAAERGTSLDFRRFALAQLGALGDASLAPRLATLLATLRKDARDDERLAWLAAAAATALGKLGAAAGDEALLDAAADPGLWPVQTAAVEALGARCPAGGAQVVRDVLAAGEGRAARAARVTAKRCGYRVR